MLIESDAPARLRVLIAHARHMVWENKPTQALDILQDAEDTAMLLLDWFRLLQEARTNLPISWTDFANMRNKKKPI